MSQCHSNREINDLSRLVQVHLLSSELIVRAKDKIFQVSTTIFLDKIHSKEPTYILFSKPRIEGQEP